MASASPVTVLPVPTILSLAPKAALAGSPFTLTVTGANLAGASFSFSSLLPVSAVTINSTGTSATMTVSPASSAEGYFTLIGANAAGLSTGPPAVGFLPTATAFNTISIPGSDPNGDPDRDAGTNAQEIALGTDPLNGDTDGDAWPDGLEVFYNSDPLNPMSFPHPPPGAGSVTSRLTSILNLLNPGTGVSGSRQYVSGPIFSMLNSLNPSTGVSGSKQYVSGPIFSMLNSLNPSTGVSGSKQYVSGPIFSMLNSLNPGAGVSGIKQYVSGPIFSMLNSLNPSSGVSGSKQYVSSPIFSILNTLNPSTGVSGSRVCASRPSPVCPLNSVSPAPSTPYLRFSYGPVFSILNGTTESTSAALEHPTVLANGTVATRTAQAWVSRPWLFLDSMLHLLDTDGDGVPDEDEIRQGTNPFDPDTDHDGYPDGLEIALGSDPLDPKSIPDINRPGFGVSQPLTIQNFAPFARIIAPALPVASRRKQ